MLLFSHLCTDLLSVLLINVSAKGRTIAGCGVVLLQCFRLAGVTLHSPPRIIHPVRCGQFPSYFGQSCLRLIGLYTLAGARGDLLILALEGVDEVVGQARQQVDDEPRLEVVECGLLLQTRPRGVVLLR